jgi:uncharacterized protein (DUF934 family)
MPLLDATGRFVADSYTREVDLLSPAGLSGTLAEASGRLGLSVENTVAIETITPFFERLSLIAIAFPAYGDGRGFSLAKRLRREGYRGTLRAVGPLIADQFAYALACGFDEIDLPEASAARQPAEHWIKAAQAFSATYQRGYPRGRNILDQRRAAQAGGRNA